MDRIRRVAVNRVIADGETVSPCVLEIEDGKIIDFYHFTGELPFTEWKGGTVVLSKTTDGWTIDNFRLTPCCIEFAQVFNLSFEMTFKGIR